MHRKALTVAVLLVLAGSVREASAQYGDPGSNAAISISISRLGARRAASLMRAPSGCIGERVVGGRYYFRFRDRCSTSRSARASGATSRWVSAFILAGRPAMVSSLRPCPTQPSSSHRSVALNVPDLERSASLSPAVGLHAPVERGNQRARDDWTVILQRAPGRRERRHLHRNRAPVHVRKRHSGDYRTQ